MPRPSLSDAELVARVKAKIEHGTGKAAELFNIRGAAFRASIQDAARRGLTENTKLKITEDQLRTRVKMLESELASREAKELTAEIVRQEIYGLAEMTPDPPKWALKAGRSPKSSGVPCTIWSDWHYGETVTKSEVGGANKFNRAVAKKRVKTLIETTVDLAKNHMTYPKYPGIAVALGGDLITGAIHEDLRETNDGSVPQSMLEVKELLIWGLETMADKFGKVFVPCVVGNHARGTPKVRFKRHVVNSWEWHIYCDLERWFARDKRIQFMIPEEAYCPFNIVGHRYMLTHGDMLGVKGGDGMIGAVGPITRGAIKVGRSQRQIRRAYDTLLMGHWHTYMPRNQFNNTIVNGALKGYDEYAYSGLVVPYSRPSQALWFTHPKYGVTAQWEIYLEEQPDTAKDAPWAAWPHKLAA